MAVASDRNNPRRELVIRPGHHDSEYLPDLWRYRELFYFLAWRDILVRYKQTVIGAAWAIVKPLLTIGVLSYIFGKLAGMPADGVPYPILVAAAMLPWQFFASSVSDCSNSLLAGSELVAKVYFPRLILPGSSMVVNLIDFAVSCVILVVLCVAYRFVPGPAIVAMPLFLLLAAVTAAGLGLWFAALIVRFRDIRHLVPFLLQLGLFASPVGFSSDVVPAQWHLLYALNPMVGVIDGFRWSILGGTHELDGPAVMVSAVVAIALLATGLVYFRRVERTFADVI
ncbi:MAG: ABC transporter permease [Gammaproteobacteria bacterium]|nr:ABC transporter permease [Gammaproteobacteria bacterium]